MYLIDYFFRNKAPKCFKHLYENKKVCFLLKRISID